MPKRSKYPKLRVHVRKGKGGQVWRSWYYDMRGTGKPDIALGSDYDQAIAEWDKIHNHRPRTAGTLEEAFEAWERDKLPKYENATTRRNYAQSLKTLRPVFGPATWDSIKVRTQNPRQQWVGVRVPARAPWAKTAHRFRIRFRNRFRKTARIAHAANAGRSSPVLKGRRSRIARRQPESGYGGCAARPRTRAGAFLSAASVAMAYNRCAFDAMWAHGASALKAPAAVTCCRGFVF